MGLLDDIFNTLDDILPPADEPTKRAASQHSAEYREDAAHRQRSRDAREKLRSVIARVVAVQEIHQTLFEKLVDGVDVESVLPAIRNARDIMGKTPRGDGAVIDAEVSE